MILELFRQCDIFVSLAKQDYDVSYYIQIIARLYKISDSNGEKNHSYNNY